MATYTLIPSSLLNFVSVTNADRAYTDTSSTTYASAYVDEYDGYLGGFDFSVIPDDEIVTAITIRAKWGRATSAGTLTAFVKSSQTSSGVVLSQTVTGTTTAAVYTFTLIGDVDTIMSYASTLRIAFHNDTSSQRGVYIYGADITVTTSPRQRNKIIYGNETLIDLTSDTATASDVASGKTFHLANGKQATGTFVASPSVATATTTATGTRTVSFTNLTKQPSWFMMICSSTDTAARNSRVQHMLYDGTTTTTYHTNGSNVGSIATSTSRGTFTYSSGTLAITVSTVYIGAADWELYYL